MLSLCVNTAVYNIQCARRGVYDGDSAVAIDNTDYDYDCHACEGGDAEHQPTILEPARDHVT